MEERRKSGRAELDSWVEIDADGVRSRATVSDVSTGGLGIALHGSALAPGTALVAEFPLPGIGLPLELRACVVWAHDRHVGLRFESVDPGLRELLASYVDGRLGP